MVQRSLADAEARAVAEEGAAAAAEEAAAVTAAEHAAAWAHHADGQQGAFSVSSSADFSQGGYSAAGDQHQYAAYGAEHAAAGCQQSAADAQGSYGQQVQGLAGNMADLSLNAATLQQKQQQQQTLQLQQLDQQHQYQYQQQLLAQQQQQQAGHTQQMQLPQQQVQPARQQLNAPSYQQQPHAALASTLDGAAPVEGPRDVLGRPVPVAAIAAPSKPAATPMSPAQMQQPLQVAAVSSIAGVPSLQLQQPLQQQQTVLPPSPQAAAACAGAVAVAAAAAAAGGDAGSQARHLTVLVHRLQSRPAEDVLAELAACAGVLCRQAWEDNFSKVCCSVDIRTEPPGPDAAGADLKLKHAIDGASKQ